MTDNRINLKIIGMTCAGCAGAVEMALKSVNGVEKAEVNLKTGTAEVEVSNDAVNSDQLILAVKLAGYSAQTISH